MAASAMTIDGLDELLSGAESFGPTFDQAAQAVAESVGRRIQTRAQEILRSKVRGNPIAITMSTDAPNRQVLVEADFVDNGLHPTEIHLMFEYGTAERQQKAGRRTGRIQPVHYMRDAVNAERAGFPRAIDAELQTTLEKVFK